MPVSWKTKIDSDVKTNWVVQARVVGGDEDATCVGAWESMGEDEPTSCREISNLVAGHIYEFRVMAVSAEVYGEHGKVQ